MGNRIVHFEIPSDDPPKAVRFYTEVFGWRFDNWGNEQYWLATTGDEGEPGINGAILRRDAHVMNLSNTISVDSIHDAVKKVKEHGGEMLSEVMPVQGVGWVAYFRDMDGNVLSMMQADPKAK